MAQSRRAAPAAAVIREMFISKWRFLNRNKQPIMITAQLAGANSFISRFRLRIFFFFQVIYLLQKEQQQKAMILLKGLTDSQ